MKKYTLCLMAALTFCYSDFTFSAISNTSPQPIWSGFYLGGNLGYWKSQTNDISTTGSASYINPDFAIGASNIANALAQLATNSFTLDPDGLIGGGQVGYNYLMSQNFLLSVNLDFDGLSNSNNNSTLQRSVNLTDFTENYVGSLAVTQKINYLGTVRLRLGYLFYPTFLVYATGGFAYGNVTLNTTWTAQESLGPEIFPLITTQNNSNKTLPGWTAGGGIEWLFKPNWSASLEYLYYSLNDLNASDKLFQTNETLSPPAPWGSAIANTALSLSVETIRIGINYHFI